MARIALGELMQREGVKVYNLHKETKLHFYTLSRYRDNQAKTISLDHVEALCKALNCQPGDLIVLGENGNGKHENSKRPNGKPATKKKRRRL